MGRRSTLSLATEERLREGFVEGEPVDELPAEEAAIDLRGDVDEGEGDLLPASGVGGLSGLAGVRGLRVARELARERARRSAVERFPTRFATVDALLDGGVARGRLTELRGRGSSGRFSVVLGLLAATTAAADPAALVDLGSTLDPALAGRAGVDLDRLLWVRPETVREALSAAEILLSGSFPLVVVELGLPPLPGGRGRDAAWLRLARSARRHRGALLVSVPYGVSGPAASEVLVLQGRRSLWQGEGLAPRLLSGLDVRVRREKSRERPEERERAAGLSLHLPGAEWSLPAAEVQPREALRSAEAQLWSTAAKTVRRHGGRGRGGYGYRMPALPPEVAAAAEAWG